MENKIIEDVKLDFSDVLIRPRKSELKSRADVDLTTKLTFKNSNKELNCVPIAASNMDTIGTFEMALALSQEKLITCVHKYYTVDEWRKFIEENPSEVKYLSPSCGLASEDMTKLNEVLQLSPDLFIITLDVANGSLQVFIDLVKTVRNRWPHHIIIAGNVVTAELVVELISAGADIVKVGLGPGSVCTTRLKTGVGYPQLSAVLECSAAAKKIGGHIMADGGCTCPGDIAKAFGAGASLVMIGGLLAGHDQSGGELRTLQNGSQVKMFYGMSSSTAMVKRSGAVPNYRSSEGRTVEVPYRGDVMNTLHDILGGLRSACTYVGAASLAQMTDKVTFLRVNQQLNMTYS